MKDGKEYKNHPIDCTCSHCLKRRACAEMENPFALKDLSYRRVEKDDCGNRKDSEIESEHRERGTSREESKGRESGKNELDRAGSERADDCGCGHHRGEDFNDGHGQKNAPHVPKCGNARKNGGEGEDDCCDRDHEHGNEGDCRNHDHAHGNEGDCRDHDHAHGGEKDCRGHDRKRGHKDGCCGYDHAHGGEEDCRGHDHAHGGEMDCRDFDRKRGHKDGCCEHNHAHGHKDTCCDHDHAHDGEIDCRDHDRKGGHKDGCCEHNHAHGHKDTCCDHDRARGNEDDCCDHDHARGNKGDCHDHNRVHGHKDGCCEHNRAHGHKDGCCDHDHAHDGDCGCGHDHGGETSKKETAIFLARAIGSAILLALGWILDLPSEWNLALLIPAYLIIGYDVVFGAVRGILNGKMFDERFLMLIASVGAFVVSEAPEGVLVMLLYQIGEFLTDLSLARSKKSISALTKLRPEFAVVVRNGEELKVAPDEVEVGETIIVRPGERIPLDGVVRKGKTTLDLSALTGESVPVGKKEGEEALSGAVNLEGLIELEVTKPFGASAVMRILETVGEASEKKTKTERFIKKFAKYYTPAVVAAAVLIAVIPPLAGLGSWERWIHTALTFLVVSCPCALVIAVPLTYFAGVGGASKTGILVKGGSVLDALKKVKTVVFDKTGTLTEGVFEVTAVTPFGEVSEKRLKTAAAAAESLSNHPIAKSVIAAFGQPNVKVSELKELSGRGISVKTETSEILAGNAKLMRESGIDCAETKSGGSIVHVAENGEYLGFVTVSDRIKQGSEQAVASLKKSGIRSFMLTGDRESSAKETAETLRLDGYRASLLPEDKVGALEELLKTESCAFVGDGVNDAPVITRADVGFAMGGMGQDAAIEAADVVIMDDNSEKVAKAIKIAKKTGFIATENIVFALTVKAAVMVLGIFGIVNMWLAVFADVGVTLLAVLNAMRAYCFRAKK